eukprot:GEMP01081532.1.p1 GENE.GEMP01081532.1~~GEMP01081532.1.p1  ORF type:complete len:250 (+),score=41.50 GEMP01081532.1:257-1006(+)
MHPLRSPMKRPQEKLRREGRQWKATPGPGTYKTQRTLGRTLSDEMSLHCNQDRLPIWKFGTGTQSDFVKISMGTSSKTPGPGKYRTWTQFRPSDRRGVNHLPSWSTAPTSTEVVCSPNLQRSQSWSCMLNHHTELDRLAECAPFHSKTGTHRASYGESLLDHGRRFDKKKYAALLSEGRHFKATPGPGTYRTQRFVGEAHGQEVSLHSTRDRLPTWKMGTGAQSEFVTKSLGTAAHSPGPGTYTDYGQF